MRVLLLSTADTELLAAREAQAGYVTANPARLDPGDLPGLTRDVDVVVVRLLGGRKTWPEGVEALRATGLPLVLLGGEADPDAELMALSTVPAGVAAEALDYLREGGVANLRELARFLSDTVLLTGEGFEPPVRMPAYGVHGERPWHEGRPTVGVVFYRAHELSGNTAFVDALCDAIERRGANALPVFCGSLRGADEGLLELLGRADALVATVLAAGGSVASMASAGGDEDAWDAGALAALDVPVIQGLCLTTSRAAWEESDAALSPMDAAMQVAIPEFDGRLISVPFSFKEEGPDGVPTYRADPERAARVAGIAVRYARLRHKPAPQRRVGIVLSSYPTKHSRVGNAVGLDTPTSAVRLLRRMAETGYDLGEDHTLWQDPGSGDALIHALIAAGGHDVEWLTEEQLRNAAARVPLQTYAKWFAALPDDLRERIREHWGEPPGELYVDGEDIVLAALRFGNVVLMIQPPRGFGENPIAIYHDPDLPPSHHYLAAYRWLEESFGADAVIHLGKHGTLEWLPGKGLGLSASCAPDAVLGDLPMIYPFIVNDPGEGTQAKRRGHATVVDHLVPPMARADTYGDLARLEQLLDEYATVQALDPAKLPAVRAQIWTLIQAAQLHHDLHQEEMPGEDEFDDFLLHVDGYLCEIKDVQIRDGLHILGQAPRARPASTCCWRSCAPPRSGAARRARSPACAPRSPVPTGWTRRNSSPSPAAGCTSREAPRPSRPGRSPFRGGWPPAGPSRRAPPPTWSTSWRTWPASWSRPWSGTAGTSPPSGRSAARSSTAAARPWSPCWRSPPRSSCPGWPRPATRSTPCCTPWTAATSPPARPGRPPAGWSTSCRPAATSTPSTPRPSRPATPGTSASPSPTP